jgi:hypothetical protein
VNSVNNIDLTKNAFVALLLVSNIAIAEDKYPASDFQPKVVYQDESATSGTSSAPAAQSSTPSPSSSNDSQYPAANFEPKVLYSDADYKHTASSPGSASSSSSYVDSSASSSAAPATVAKEESSIGYLLGLVVLGVAGFVLFKKGAAAVGGGQKNRVVNPVRSSGGLTGVARYVLKTSGTGVSRYLEKNTKSAVSSASATGVAKYLASKGSSTKPAATGVEKYMRNKG